MVDEYRIAADRSGRLILLAGAERMSGNFERAVMQFEPVSGEIGSDALTNNLFDRRNQDGSDCAERGCAV